MGAEGSGKSSLLHIIGDQKLSSGSEICGKVYYNNKSVDEGKEDAWQKCAFVEAVDFHFRDLTVHEVLSYALELRNHEEDMSGIIFEQTLDQTITLLQLDDVKNTRVKFLTPGETRRLSIAEEIVIGPMLVLLDEPITGLDARESSIIITQTLRELVNQDRTVICTLHQASAAVFDLVDTLVLLSKGRLIYMGPASKAMEFFVSSPSLGIADSQYNNPAEFLFRISAGLVSNDSGQIINTESLEKHYCESAIFGYYNGMETLKSNDNIQKMLDDPDNDEKWRCASFDETSPDSFARRSMNYSTVLGSPSYWDLIFLQYFLPFLTFFHDLVNIDFGTNCRRSGILMRRSFRLLLQRPRLIFFTTLTHILTAIFMVDICKDSKSNTAAAVTPTAAFGGFLLMVMNIQFAFFLYHNQQVFLREHSRGLYSAFLRWLIDPIPLILLRSLQGFFYALIVHEGLDLQGGDVGIYFMLMTWFMCLACTMIIESICYTLKDIRDVYGTIIGTAFMLFLFSGMFFKPSTLPGWMAPWVPSVSIIRWYAQGIVNNEFDGNTEVSEHLWWIHVLR